MSLGDLGHDLLAWRLSELRGFGHSCPLEPVLCLVQGRYSITLAEEMITAPDIRTALFFLNFGHATQHVGS